MKAQLKPRPQSRKIRTESGNPNRRANAVLGQEYFKKGKAEQMGGNYDRAIELYTLATTCKSNYFQAYCNMGYCYRALGKFGEAKRSYQSALYSNPTDHISHYNLANLYRVIGENEQAIEEYTQVIGLKQKGANVGTLYLDSLVNIGICYKNRGEIDEAIKVNRKVLEEDSSEPSATFNLAICLLNSIEAKNSRLFNKFYHERASEAEKLFRNVLSKSSDNLMAQFSLEKVLVILNPSHQNVENAIAHMKEILSNPKCDIKDEINEEIGRCLSQLKKFDESARYYENSIGGISRKASQSKKAETKIDNIFETFSHQKIPQQDVLDSSFLTQAEGIALIEGEHFKTAQKKISELDQGLLKSTLRLILQLKIAEIDTDNADNAIIVYNQYFNKSEEELPFNKLSLQAHKAIGKILSLQHNYQESIKHYEHISQSIKNNRNSASAKLHSQLGERFEEVGNRQKALEEYKKGIQIQPDNYSLSYSMGYCLYENGSYEEAKECFQRIIKRIRSDPDLDPETKELYQTDCMIICALCTTYHSTATFELFTSAYKKLQKLQLTRENSIEMQQENLQLFYIRISELYEEKVSSCQPDDPHYKEWAELLIAIYQSLLDLRICPDRDEILTNSGNLSYQLGHYATTVQTYSQISSTQLFPPINMALAYAHLIEPALALKYVQQACQMEPKQPLNAFCKEVLEWIYLAVCDGQWSKHFPAFKQDLFYARNQYGVAILDKLSEAINNPSYNPKTQDKLLESLAKHHERIKSTNQLINLKLQSLSLIEKQRGLTFPKKSPKEKQVGILSPDLLKLCFSKSTNIVRDLQQIMELLQKMPSSGRESEFCEAAIYLFTYYNQLDSQVIQQYLVKMTKRTKQCASINSPQQAQNSSEIYSIYPDFSTVKEAIVVLKEWEAVLEPSTRQTFKVLEKSYYRANGSIVQPFEAEYHFPRHCNLSEQDQTFEKFISIVLSVLKYDKKLICKGVNVHELRTDLIRQFETHYNRYLKSSSLKPIFITDTFLPLTLYAVHENKQACQAFLNDVAKQLKGEEIKIGDCEEIVVIANKLIRVRCRWHNPYEIGSILQEVIDSIVENPLFIVNQAIIYLENIIHILKMDSSEAKKYISLDSTLNF